MIAYLLRKYDELFEDNLYSFRYDRGVKKAINLVRQKVEFNEAYAYKVDVSNYFNSINVKIMLRILNDSIPNEKKLIQLISNMLNNPNVKKGNQVVAIDKGVMAGVPIAGFLANLYLTEMDKWFSGEGIIYIRYSDDIIIFAETRETIEKYKIKLHEFLEKYQLKINPSKEFFYNPGESVEFLGFSFSPLIVDASEMSIQKLKGKLKRKARALYRWKIKIGASDERTVKAYIRFLNRKFYDKPYRGDITWCRWYFPVITTDNSLKMIDEYAIQCVRYLYTGNYSKKNYNIAYDTIKEMGF